MKKRVSVAKAVEMLREGGLVALPTETVYGLAADALQPDAVAQIFKAKGRPQNHPLIVHLPSAERVAGWAEMSEAAWALAARFWPGPLTLILPRGPLALDAVTGGRETVGVRVPAHPMTLEVLAALGSGVAAPSANLFGHVSPTRPEHVEADLGEVIDGVVDGGPCEVGLESTIVDLSVAEPVVLRVGAISLEALSEVLGRPVGLADVAERTAEGERAKAPGQLSSHYAPRARLRILTPGVAVPEGAVVLGEKELGGTAESWAQRLYGALRDADAQGPEWIVIPTPPAGAMEAALLDRLRRASVKS